MFEKLKAALIEHGKRQECDTCPADTIYDIAQFIIKERVTDYDPDSLSEDDIAFLAAIPVIVAMHYVRIIDTLKEQFSDLRTSANCDAQLVSDLLSKYRQLIRVLATDSPTTTAHERS